MIFKHALITLFYFLLFNFLIYRLKRLQLRNFKPVVTSLLFNLKFVVGILIWVIYTFYYKDIQNNDVHKFYNDALVLREAANENPKAFIALETGIHTGANTEAYTNQMRNWQRNFDEAPFNENRTVIRLNALLMFLSFRTYFVHILFMCFISLIGWVLLANAISNFMDAGNSILILPVLLLPSVLFWTSGVMKEPVLGLGLGLILNVVLMRNAECGMRNWLSGLAGVIIILFTKFFVLACLIPALVAFYLFKKQEKFLPVLIKYLVVNLILLLAAFNVYRVIPQINLQQMLVNKQAHSIKEATYFNAGSRIDIPVVSNSTADILEVAPVGIWNTMFRPYLWEGKNIMMLASALENVLVIIFILLCLAYTDFKNFKNLNLVLLLLNFAIGYYALIGICTPVLGNLVRYRAPLLPVFLFAFVLNVKLKKRVDVLRC